MCQIWVPNPLNFRALLMGVRIGMNRLYETDRLTLNQTLSRNELYDHTRDFHNRDSGPSAFS